jgi:hypothetical protein
MSVTMYRINGKYYCQKIYFYYAQSSGSVWLLEMNIQKNSNDREDNLCIYILCDYIDVVSQSTE